MTEFFDKVFSLSVWEILADSHGGLAMVSLVLFGAAIVLILNIDKFAAATKWLRGILVALLANIALLDAVGLYIYIPYRKEGGPRSTLLATENTAWLHQIIFEHKEFLAFAPLVILLVATVVAFTEKNNLKQPRLRNLMLFSLAAALVMLLAVAAEAVLVTKAAPLR